MTSNSFIITILGRLRAHAEGRNDVELMQQVEDAEATAIKEIFRDGVKGNPDCYGAVMKVVFPDMVQEAQHD
jgi:hypothetical protein